MFLITANRIYTEFSDVRRVWIAEPWTMNDEGKTLNALAKDLVATARAEGFVDAQGLMLDLRSETDTLVISCSGIVPYRIIYAMENTSKLIDTNKLFICDAQSLWYYDGIKGLTSSFDETVDLIGAVVELLGFRSVYAIGTSAGGYMALALGARLGLSRVLALSPQTTLGHQWRTANAEYRWADRIAKIHELVGPETPYLIQPLIEAARPTRDGAPAEFHVVVSEHNPLDVSYVDMISDNPQVSVYKVPDPDHNVAGALRRRGKLFDLMTGFIHAGATEINAAMSRLLEFEPATPESR